MASGIASRTWCYEIFRSLPYSGLASCIAAGTGLILCAKSKDQTSAAMQELKIDPWLKTWGFRGWDEVMFHVGLFLLAVLIADGVALVIGILGSGRTRELLFGIVGNCAICNCLACLLGNTLVLVVTMALWATLFGQLLLSLIFLVVWFIWAGLHRVCLSGPEAIENFQKLFDVLHKADATAKTAVDMQKVCKVPDNLGNAHALMFAGCVVTVASQATMVCAMIYYKERIRTEHLVAQAQLVARDVSSQSEGRERKHGGRAKKKRPQDTRSHHSSSDAENQEDERADSILRKLWRLRCGPYMLGVWCVGLVLVYILYRVLMASIGVR